MGVLIEQGDDPKVCTPRVFLNSTGYVKWGGRNVANLSAAEMVAVLEFCADEGFRQGWNAGNQGADHHPHNPFARELLGGYPYREWSEHYERGRAAWEDSLSGTAALG